MTIRPEVADLLAIGTFPDEETDDVELVDRIAALIDRIARPVSDEEAQALATLFGPDFCFGVAWSLLHLIETAPGAHTAVYPHDEPQDWLCRLTMRAGFTCTHSAQATE